MAGALQYPCNTAHYDFQTSDVKQEPFDDSVYAAFKSEYDAFDLDAVLFDADIGWGAEGLDAGFFDEPLPSDGAVPSLSTLSDGGDSIPQSASCTSLDSIWSSDGGEELLLGGKVPTGARSRRGTSSTGTGARAPQGSAHPTRRLLAASSEMQRSVPVVLAAKPWTPPSVLPPLSMTRQERVQRYREKRKRRTFEKTIRYEARRAYAEVRPRIKGRFATKDEAAAMKAAKLAGVPYVC